MALKKVSELDKSEKLFLLNAIAAGEVDREKLTPDTLFAINYQDAFLGLMVAANNEGTNIICLGAALKAKNEVSEGKQDGIRQT